MAYDISQMRFAKGFEPKEIQLVHDKGRTLILSFRNNFQGRDDFNIREVYEQYGEWLPGKGITVPYEKKAELLQAIRNLK